MLAAPRAGFLPRQFISAAVSLIIVLAGAGSALGGAQETGTEPEIPHFREISALSELKHSFDSDAEFSIGGGAAAFDCDGDKDADLFVAGGNAVAGLFRNMYEPGTPLKFENISVNLGLRDADSRRASGGYALDFDNDGDVDLFVMRFGQNWLLENDGNCNFAVSEQAALPQMDERTTAFAAGWMNEGPFPDLFVGNHVTPAQEPGATGQCDASYVHVPVEGDAPDYSRVKPLAPSYCPLSYLLVDWSGHGRFDLRASNDITA
ncbi:MAG TPA: VCBS repeat-containing protein, partial [Afifellaceae bacterium]|nr:VCBS repeat-containing protein [Afifellaceae bacterium]